MKIDTGKIAVFFKDVRTIVLGVASIGAVILWVGSQYFITVDEADRRELKQLKRELKGLKIRQGFAKSENDKQLYKALIDMQLDDISTFKGE